MPPLRPRRVQGAPLAALARLSRATPWPRVAPRSDGADDAAADRAEDVRDTRDARDAHDATGTTSPAWPDVVVTGVSLDSRSVQPGDLYAALPGFTTHGAAFAAAAVAQGAVAVLTDPDGVARLDGAGVRGEGDVVPVLVVDRPRNVLGELSAQVYDRPADGLTLVGITGTNGKTTTAYLVESGLRHLAADGSSAPTTGLIGTVETRVGAQRLPSARTTPEAPELHATFAVMREAGVSTVVMEVSSHALAQHRVDGAVYDVALFTNLSQDHLDFHADMEDYFRAKALLFTPAHARRGLVSLDDEWGRRLHEEAGIPVETITSKGDVIANWRVRQLGGPDFTVEGQHVTLHLTCRLPGDFNVLNTAMAAVTLLMLGNAPALVEEAMSHDPEVPGRMERVTATTADTDDPRVLVDYAHTPDAVDCALGAIRPGTDGDLVVVLGAGGDRDRGKRPAMGAAAARWADVVIVTDDNPRSEDPAAIRAAVQAGAEGVERSAHAPRGDVTGPRVENIAGRASAIEVAVRSARQSGRAGDSTVLILGKGHETGQEIAGVTHAFDDRDAARAALDGLPYRPGDPA